KKGTGLSHGPSFPSKDSYVPERPPGPNARSKSRRSSVPSDPQGEADRILLSRYPPPGVLVNSELEILQFRGDTGPFLAAPAGKASHGLIKMLREGLMVAVRSAINRARKEEAMIRKNGLRVKYDGRYRSVSIDVIPIKGRATRDDYFLVLFHESGSAGRSRSRREGRERAADATTPREAYRLKQELTVTREYLQSVVEQQEAAYEELQSANEEVQSANEELQSINEELETSKEEIQSSNEELATVNDELNSRNTELAQSNSDLVNLLSSVQMAIVMVGPDLRIRRFTPLAERMVNLIASDIGRPLGDITLNIDLPNLVDLVKEVIDTVMPQQREVQDRDGRWFSLRVRPYKTIDNRIDGAVLVLVDVDAMKRTEDSLRTSEARYRIVHEQAPLGIFETDLQGRFLQVNDQFCAMTGRSREQLLELRSGDITAPDDLAVDLEAFRRIREGAVQSVRVQKRYLKSSGEAVWTEVYRFGISDADGTPRFTVGFVQDIGERLSGEQTLRESQAALQDADLKKDHFIAMLAHELRNPLAPLRNISQLLHTPNLDAPTLTWVRGVLQRQLGNIERMVDDLLDVSRITQEKIRLQREKLALAVIVDRAVETLSDQLAATNKQLTVTLPPGTVMLDVDPVRMDQILGNLLYNSLKFTIPGGHIWVDAIVSAASPNEIEIRVRDDGQGIPPDLLPKVFDLFTQADVSLERTHGGLGIGLTLVKKLAELHGGTVEAHSDGPGTGAEFVVRMPVVSSARVKVGDSALPTSNGGVVDSFRILVVDDHIDTAMVTGALLRRAGHEVEMVHSGTEVEEATRRFKPEIILLDIGLPGMDGYAVARQLREEWKSAGPLLIAVSGYGGDEVHQRALSAGFNAYITKPYDLEGLNEVFATLR
ncbi:MAG TPA: PAS domain S-box protein, partial [Gemmatimonadales bacterium]|nr:PAS domain S-box protein [Gemmatimonadales bacterium]